MVNQWRGLGSEILQNNFILTWNHHTTTTTTTILRPFFQDHPGEPVPEENFWTLWCKGRLTEADTSTMQLGATPSGPTSANLCHPPWNTEPRLKIIKAQHQSNYEHSYVAELKDKETPTVHMLTYCSQHTKYGIISVK